MPEATFTIKGSIEDFSRIDNLYAALKREATKLLAEWELDVIVEYKETKREH